MSVKSEVLSILEANRETDLSGEELAGELGVSRTSIWKAIHALKQEGYQIQAVNNRGYRLQESNDVLSEEGIRLALGRKYQDYPIEVHKTLDSTNEEIKRRIPNGGIHGLTILAEEQTKGKGRLGREFYSPSGTGIYMSFLIKPDLEGSDAVLITTAASVAVSLAIEKVLGAETQIKWVNDVYLGKKKICGILTEAISDFEIGKIDSVIVGIGINYRTEDFPAPLREKAGGLQAAASIPRNALVASVLNEFWNIYENLRARVFLQEYRKRSNVLNKTVRFQENGHWQEAKTLDIDDNGGLVVEYEDSEKKTIKRTLHTGEITLRI